MRSQWQDPFIDIRLFMQIFNPIKILNILPTLIILTFYYNKYIIDPLQFILIFLTIFYYMVLPCQNGSYDMIDYMEYFWMVFCGKLDPATFLELLQLVMLGVLLLLLSFGLFVVLRDALQLCIMSQEAVFIIRFISIISIISIILHFFIT